MWVLGWMMFLILCYFLFPSVCVTAVCSVCAVGVLVGLVVWILGWMMILILCCFLLPSWRGGCLCGGISSGTASVNFVLDDISNTMLFSAA